MFQPVPCDGTRQSEYDPASWGPAWKIQGAILLVTGRVRYSREGGAASDSFQFWSTSSVPHTMLLQVGGGGYPHFTGIGGLKGLSSQGGHTPVSKLFKLYAAREQWVCVWAHGAAVSRGKGWKKHLAGMSWLMNRPQWHQPVRVLVRVSTSDYRLFSFLLSFRI